MGPLLKEQHMAQRSKKGRKKAARAAGREVINTGRPSRSIYEQAFAPWSPSAHDSFPSTGSTSRTTTGFEPPGPHQRPLNETVQLKLRFSEALRRKLEEAAASNQRSLNAEIIKRLEGSFLSPDRIPRLVADALLEGLDPDVITAMSETIIEDWQSDQATSLYDWREDQFDREGK
jgi:Arc-like DNA binding domain